MRINLSLLRLWAMVCALSFGGCFKLGPDYERPDVGIKPPPTYQHSQLPGNAYALDLTWWKEFNDSQLERVVSQALKRNWDIRKAAERVAEMASLVTGTRAEKFPTLGLDGNFERQKRPIIGLMPGRTFTTKTDSFVFSLPAFYEIDLWGRVARAQEAAIAQLIQAEETKKTVIQGVISEAIALYFKINAIEHRLSIAQKQVRNYAQVLKTVETRYNRGLTSILDVKAARKELAQARSQIPYLRLELGSAKQSLSILIGNYPDSRILQSPKADYVSGLKPVPSGIPSELLKRRPDVRAAEARLQALNALVGVAKANRFPRITLTGSFGYASDELKGLFDSSNELWNIALGLVQPLFDAGRLKAEQRASEARYRQGVAEYAKTVLRAFYEVENALLTRKEQLERLQRLKVLLKQAKDFQRIAENRYSRGLVDYLAVLEAQRARYLAEDELVLVKLAILTNRVALYRALGGSWGRINEVPGAHGAVLGDIQ